MASIFGLRGWMAQSPGTGLYRSARRRVGPEPATFRFRTGGHYRGSDAVLMIEVIGLNGFFEPEIQVNGQAVGHLRPNRGANENWMWTQMVVFAPTSWSRGSPILSRSRRRERPTVMRWGR